MVFRLSELPVIKTPKQLLSTDATAFAAIAVMTAHNPSPYEVARCYASIRGKALASYPGFPPCAII